MAFLEVRLFGSFKICSEGLNVIEKLAGSKKGILLLEYLLLNSNRPIASSELYNVLWPKGGLANPGGSLKTLVSRLRSNLSEFGMQEMIETCNNAYRWNSSMAAEIDAVLFEALCRKLEAETELTETARQSFEKAMQLYAGELLPQAADDEWILSRRRYYHDMYVSMLTNYIGLLSACNDYENVIRVCRRGLELDSANTNLNAALMSGLLKLGRNSEALAQYNHVNDLLCNQTSETNELYNRLAETEQSSHKDLTRISQELNEACEMHGALVCDYSIFKDIYQINRRSLHRLGIPVHLGLVSLSSTKPESLKPMVLDKIMRSLLETMRCNLRRGDTIARYSLTQYAVLLPSTDLKSASLALERIKSEFYRVNRHPDIILNCSIAHPAQATLK